MSELGTEVQIASEPVELNENVPQGVRDLIARCIEGTEPLPRPLKSNENDKLTPLSVQVIFMRIAGYRNHEVADILGVSQAFASVVWGHPYARKIVHALTGQHAEMAMDVKSQLERRAMEVVERIADLARTETDLDKVSNAGFGLLDRAGYNPKSRVEIDQRVQRVSASEHTLARVASALEESKTVDSKIMATYIPKPPPDDPGVVETVDDRAIAALRKAG